MLDVVRISLFITVKIVVPMKYNKKCKGFNQHCTTGPPYPQPCCPGYVCKKKCGARQMYPRDIQGDIAMDVLTVENADVLTDD